MFALRLMLVFVLFLSGLITLVLFPSTEKVPKKSWNLLFVYLQVIWPLTNIRETWTWECVLLLNYWHFSLKSKRVHLCNLQGVRSTDKFGKLSSWREEHNFQKNMQRSRGCCREREKACLSPPGGERKNDEAEQSFVTPKAERRHRESKKQQQSV